jgi:hypothetical protein
MARSASLLLAACVLIPALGLTQVQPAAGIQPFHTLAGGQVDSFDLATSNILVQIPVRSKLGKTPFSYELVGNSGAWIWVRLMHAPPIH